MRPVWPGRFLPARMVIHCCRCGRPVVAVEPPKLEGAHVWIVRRFLVGAGLELGPELDVIVNPTPETIASTFNVRCLECASG